MIRDIKEKVLPFSVKLKIAILKTIKIPTTLK
jgi:hypothetical protein